MQLPFGDTDGCIQGKRYFYARKNYAVFATVNMLKFPQGEKLSKYANGIDTKQKSTSKLAEKQSRIEDLGSYLGLKIGMRVATFVDDSKDKDKVLRGVIRFIGQERDKKEVLIGIELVSFMFHFFKECLVDFLKTIFLPYPYCEGKV